MKTGLEWRKTQKKLNVFLTKWTDDIKKNEILDQKVIPSNALPEASRNQKSPHRV